MTLVAPVSVPLADSFGRVARDLRVSLTEKCNLRCRYCMPAAGLPLSPVQMNAEETLRLIGLAVEFLGIAEVRFTGGEPLLRKDLEYLIGRLRSTYPQLPVAITTNALGLEKRLPGLIAAGLTRVNISLDTVDRDRFARLTRRDLLPQVLRGVEAARSALSAGQLRSAKLNAVLYEDTLAGAAELVGWSAARGLELRFIEHMPLDADHTWDKASFTTAADLHAELSRTYLIAQRGRPGDAASPAETWELSPLFAPAAAPAAPVRIGVIASMTRAFCASCDRTRLTSEGTVRACLFSQRETDLLGLIRAGAGDAELAAAWLGTHRAKQAGHGVNSGSYRYPQRSMGAIGG